MNENSQSDSTQASHGDRASSSASTQPMSATFPPEGYIRRDEAAKLFGISIDQFKRLCSIGRIQCGHVVAKPGRGWCKIYPIDELIKIRDQMNSERGTLPEGLVSLEDAREMFGISRTGWKRWQNRGFIPKGQWIQKKGMRTLIKAFTWEELSQIEQLFNEIGKPYPDPDRPDVYRVPVMSFHRTKCEAIIDACDLPKIEGRRWNWIDRADQYLGCVEEARPQQGTPLKHVILDLKTSENAIAHANGDPLDCRRENLIVRTISEKCAASRKMRTYAGVEPSSRFKGVSWDSKREYWRVMIQKDGIHRYLGKFYDEIAAAQAYDEAAQELFGEHARINFPNGVDEYLERQAA